MFYRTKNRQDIDWRGVLTSFAKRVLTIVANKKMTVVDPDVWLWTTLIYLKLEPKLSLLAVFLIMSRIVL